MILAGSCMDRSGSEQPSMATDDANDLAALISRLDQDRSWLLEQIDRGRWPDLRLDLAALERELGQLLAKASERLEQSP